MDINKIKELENARRNNKPKKILLSLGAILIVAGLITAMFTIMVGIILIIIGVILAIVGFSNVGKGSPQDFKNLVINDLLADICSEEVIYNQHDHISLKEIKESNLLHRPDKITGEDLIIDTYKNVKYGVSDLCLQEERVRMLPNGDAYTEYLTYFKGMFMIFDYPGDLKGELYIIPKTSQEALKLETIESESIDLNEKYTLYTTNKEYAFQILTPLCVQKILALNKIYKGIISYAFTVDKLFIALNSQVNFLDIPADKPITEAAVRKLESDLMLPQAIINEFQLDKGKFQR